MIEKPSWKDFFFTHVWVTVFLSVIVMAVAHYMFGASVGWTLINGGLFFTLWTAFLSYGRTLENRSIDQLNVLQEQTTKLISRIVLKDSEITGVPMVVDLIAGVWCVKVLRFTMPERTYTESLYIPLKDIKSIEVL